MVAEVSTSPGISEKLVVRDLSIRFGDKVALRDVNLEVAKNEIFGIIGPAGSGKTSFLRAISRMDPFTPNMQIEGQILFDGRDTSSGGTGSGAR